MINDKLKALNFGAFLLCYIENINPLFRLMGLGETIILIDSFPNFAIQYPINEWDERDRDK